MSMLVDELKALPLSEDEFEVLAALLKIYRQEPLWISRAFSKLKNFAETPLTQAKLLGVISNAISETTTDEGDVFGLLPGPGEELVLLTKKESSEALAYINTLRDRDSWVGDFVSMLITSEVDENRLRKKRAGDHVTPAEAAMSLMQNQTEYINDLAIAERMYRRYPSKFEKEAA